MHRRFIQSPFKSYLTWTPHSKHFCVSAPYNVTYQTDLENFLPGISNFILQKKNNKNLFGGLLVRPATWISDCPLQRPGPLMNPQPQPSTCSLIQAPTGAGLDAQLWPRGGCRATGGLVLTCQLRVKLTPTVQVRPVFLCIPWSHVRDN